MNVNDLSDADLLSRLHGLRLDARRIDTRVIALLIEVEERRLHLRLACSSLFDFCRRKLGMSEGAAFRRINAARLAKRFPSLLSHIENGTTNLSSLVLLRDHLTEANVEELVAAASGKTKREVEELLVRRAPRPDVPSTIRKLPSAPVPPPPAGRHCRRCKPRSCLRHRSRYRRLRLRERQCGSSRCPRRATS